MKQSAAKTLGVAALGAAFAAAGAGAANAAPAALPDAGQTLDTVARTLPTEHLNQTLPGSAEALLTHGSTGPAATLLGGLPMQTLPAHGTPVTGVQLA
ncbi:ATP-binding protein [Streptomyces gossypiisoli]|uniref:ATP-binding protein n=1 Tax=Streptomyces gossypiisoli TaxID=2748864 RepID=UPI0015DB5102|nr:ATP-binding protein [Streptomyces gossypiisoli]